MIVSSISLHKGGTNTPILKGKSSTRQEIIIKQYGFETHTNNHVPRLRKGVYQTIFNDMLELRHKVHEAGVNIPILFEHKYVSDSQDYKAAAKNPISGTNGFVRLLFIESYCGQSLRDELTCGEFTRTATKELVARTEKLILKLPENLEIDVNPANFTFHNNKIYFVDFMPPKIVSYQQSRDLVGLFPQIMPRETQRELRRHKRYSSKDGRIERFRYYLNLILKNP